MDALTALNTRTTIGQLVEPAPRGAELDALFTAATRAPDHGRLRPWRFFTIDGEARAAFGDLMAQSALRRDPGASAENLERERAKAQRSPLIIAVGAKIDSRHPKIPAVEQLLAAGAAAQNLLLAAHAKGYGAAWKTGPATYDEAVKAAFGLGADDALVGFVYLGTPARPPMAAPAGETANVVTAWTGR
jgi:nitroreductase